MHVLKSQIHLVKQSVYYLTHISFLLTEPPLHVQEVVEYELSHSLAASSRMMQQSQHGGGGGPGKEDEVPTRR
jgi:hypothetical protein